MQRIEWRWNEAECSDKDWLGRKVKLVRMGFSIPKPRPAAKRKPRKKPKRKRS